MSTIVTNVAMIRTNEGMRTVSGIIFEVIEMTTFDPINTKVVARPMPESVDRRCGNSQDRTEPEEHLCDGVLFYEPSCQGVDCFVHCAAVLGYC